MEVSERDLKRETMGERIALVSKEVMLPCSNNQIYTFEMSGFWVYLVVFCGEIQKMSFCRSVGSPGGL